MRLFSQISADDELIISESILSGISDLFGSKSGKVIGGIKKFTKNSSELPKKIKLIYKLTISSLNDIVDEEEKAAAEQLLSSYKDTEDIDEIASLNYKYLMRSKFTKSKFNYNLLYLTKEICSQSKNPQVRDYIKDLSSVKSKQKVETNIEKRVEDIKRKSTDKVEDKKEIKKKVEEPSIDSIEKKEPEKEITKEEVVKVVKTDPIKELCEKVNIDSTKLYNVMFQKITDDKSLNIDDADDIILGLSTITCGALLLKESSKIKSVLQSIGINDSEDFIKNLEKVAN